MLNYLFYIRSTKEKEKELTDEEFLEKQKEYEKKYKSELKHYGMLKKPEDSKKSVLLFKK